MQRNGLDLWGIMATGEIFSRFGHWALSAPHLTTRA